MIGRETVKIIVQCPKCGFEYKTIVAKSSICKRCGHNFVVFPKRGKSRVVRIAEGTYQEFLQVYRKYVNPKGVR